MMDAIRGWLSIIRWIGFWGVWVIYFLIHKGVDEGWADRHNVWWSILAVATFVFYISFQQYLDWNVPGPNPTPCIFATFLAGVLIGRYAIPHREQ